MATNIPVTAIDFKRWPLTSAIETGIVLEGTNVARLIQLRAKGAIARISRTPGGTYSTDDYITLEVTAGQDEWVLLQDVAIKPMDAVGTYFYARAQAAATVLEIIWGQ